MSDDLNLQKLLRLKRHEQPPPEYFEKFLSEFQRRQRSELLRQPLWRIALERLGALLSVHSAGRYAYAGATAIVLLAAIASVKTGNNPSENFTAQNRRPISTANRLAIEPGHRFPDLAPQFAPANQTYSSRPHYVIDARPVSYEPNFSF